MKIKYLSMNEEENKINAPYIAGAWAIIKSENEIIASGFENEFDAIDFVRKYYGNELANQFEQEFSL